jgi:hypothetical protein
VPSSGFLGQCAVVSLQHFGLKLPASVTDKVAQLGMLPDFAAWLVVLGGPIRKCAVQFRDVAAIHWPLRE